ncbi:MAG: hypothetical protein Q4A37_00905 [Candidatus Saccharibacteria bacterium]|nr:hypothetical protein [Candidatus Saccharibacteria bacterium]
MHAVCHTNDMYNFWRKQAQGKPLFPDVEWNRPERRDLAGRLGIIGGNKLGFAAVADSYQAASSAGAGQVRVLLPDALKKSVPPSMTDVLFAPTTTSGGLSGEAASDVAALREWADVLLLCGDAGKNSQTAVLYESLLTDAEQPVVLTRDAIDLALPGAAQWLDNPRVIVVASFAQTQKLLRAVYYPKMLTFRMQLAQLVEVLHKFTISYPVTLVTFHAEQLVMARGGEVITQEWSQPMQLWRGQTAARMAAYALWSPEAPLAAVSASIAGDAR